MDRLTEKLHEGCYGVSACKTGCEHDNKYCGDAETTCPSVCDCFDKLGRLEDLEEKCIEETTFSLVTMLRKWREFQDDIAQWLEWRELAKSGRLVVLPEGDGRTLLISALAHSEICPHNCGLKEYCHIAGCKDCWEAALKGERNGD